MNGYERLAFRWRKLALWRKLLIGVLAFPIVFYLVHACILFSNVDRQLLSFGENFYLVAYGLALFGFSCCIQFFVVLIFRGKFRGSVVQIHSPRPSKPNPFPKSKTGFEIPYPIFYPFIPCLHLLNLPSLYPPTIPRRGFALNQPVSAAKSGSLLYQPVRCS